MLSLKAQLHRLGIQMLTSKIAQLEEMIDSIQESKHNETKSSAGDKYETGRAMMQMEEDKIRAQLDISRHTLHLFSQINPSLSPVSVQPGSLIQTNRAFYFLSASLGKLTLDGQVYFCISALSPIGRLLLGKTVGNEIVFNGSAEKILSLA